MSQSTVTTQAELDAALADPSIDEIIIRSPHGVWLDLRHWGAATVHAWGSATVRASGSATVHASDSATVHAWGWATVRASDSATVHASGSATVHASRFVAVHLHSQWAVVEGGVVIDLTAIDELDPKTWCELHGVEVVDGIARLFKALDANLQAGHNYTPTTYAVGADVAAADWRDDNECGGGLHLGPTTHHATAYRTDAVRWVRCEVPVASIRPILDGTAKCKVRACRVVAEVDINGAEVAA